MPRSIEKIKETEERYISYKDRFPSGFDFDEFTRPVFTTGCLREDIKGLDENRSTIRSNNRFKLYFKLPTCNSASQTNLLILINGFDEPPRGLNLYYSRDDSISRRLSSLTEDPENKIFQSHHFPSVLLPIPFHHWRRPVEGEYQEIDSETMIYSDPIRLFLGFRQLLYDFEHLLEWLLDKNTLSQLKKPFAPNFKIHVLGYSIGGLAANAILLFNRMISKHQIGKCFQLASGVNLLYANLTVAKLKPLVQNRIKIHYYKKPHAWRDELDLEEYKSKPMKHDALIQNLFERVVLGYQTRDKRFQDIEEVWVQYQQDIQYINCELDEVMLKSLIEWGVPRGVSPKELFSIDGATHWLVWDKAWKKEYGNEAVKRIAEEMINTL